MEAVNKEMEEFKYIIASSVYEREFRPHTRVASWPPGFFSHSQKFSSLADIAFLLNYHLSRLELWPQYFHNFRVAIVLASSNEARTNQLLELLRIPKFLSDGRLEIQVRENHGRSFGSYQFAIQNLCDTTRRILLTEDDVIVYPHQYLADFSERPLDSTSQGSFSAIIGRGLSRKHPLNYHSHGGVGILIAKKPIGTLGLKVYQGDKRQLTAAESATKSEIFFDSRLKKQGIKVSQCPKNLKLYSFVYDDIRNLTYPRYLSPLTSVRYLVTKGIEKLRNWL